MKRFLLTVITCAIITLVNAQYIKPYTTAPKIGDTFSQAQDTMPQVTRGGSGAAQVWDLNDFDLDEDFYDTYQDPISSLAADEFPEADVILPWGFETRFFDITPNGMFWIGVSMPNFSTGEEEAARLNPVEVMYEFPSTYGTAFTNTSAYKLAYAFDSTITDPNSGITYDIDSLRFSYNSSKVVEWDAWGELKTAFGDFPVTTRERVYQIVQNKFEICIHNPAFPVGPRCVYQDVSEITGFGSIDTAVIYSWYGPQSSFPLAIIGYEANDTDVSFAILNIDVQGQSITEKSPFNSGVVYPNPAADRFYLKGIENAEQVTISDVTGKVVKSITPGANNTTVDVSDLNNGNYIVTILSRQGVTTDKLTIVK